MKLSITASAFTVLNPQLKIAFIIAKDLDCKRKLTESRHLLAEAEKLIHLTFNKDTYKSHHLISPWNVARQEFGSAAKHYHTSVEKLLKDVLAKKKIHSSNTLTNLLRYLALKHIVPFGADDLDKVTGDITFTVASSLKKSSAVKLKKGELYYHDSKQILGAKLDYWKNPATAVTPTTTSALIHFEFLPPLTGKKLKIITKEAVELIETFCGGKARVVTVDKKRKAVSI